MAANLKTLRKSLNLTQKEISEALGVTQAYYSEIETGKKQPGRELLERAAALFGEKADLTVSDHPTDTRPHVPFEVFAGRLCGVAESIALADCEQRPIIPYVPEYDFTLTVTGQSMSPKFESGDIIAVREVRDTIRWGETYVVASSEGVAIKRVYDNGDSLRLVSYNPDYPEYTLPKSPDLRFYKVTSLIRIF